MEIGIIGYGVIGKALHNMLDGHEVSIKDPALNMPLVPNHAEAIFVCVPTPTVNGKRDHHIIEQLFHELEQLEYRGLVVIKSTISPFFCDTFKNYDLEIMVAPEFLDQHSPYYAHTKHLIGVSKIEHARLYREIFGLKGYGHEDIRTTSPKTAVMAKNVHNCFGATKVAFFNEINDICEKENVCYREMLKCIWAMNENIHPQYTRIACDGEKGYGGACFGKDSVAFAGEYDAEVLNAACKANIKWREDYMKKFY
jgi:UDPglucose 6-dehydrogenase